MTDKLNAVLASISASGSSDAELAASLIEAEPTVQDIEAQEVSAPVAEACNILGIKYTDDINVLAAAFIRYHDSVADSVQEPYIDTDRVKEYVAEYRTALSKIGAFELRMMYLNAAQFNGTPEQNTALATLLIERAGVQPEWEAVINNGGHYVRAVPV